MKKIVFYAKSGLFFVFTVITMLLFAFPLVGLYTIADWLIKNAEDFINWCDDLPYKKSGKWFMAMIDKYFDNGKFRRYTE